MNEEFCDTFFTKEDACNKCMENNYLFPLFFMISFVPFTFLTTTWVVANYVWFPYMIKLQNEWPLIKGEETEEETEEESGEESGEESEEESGEESEEESEEESVEEVPYEDKYPISDALNDNAELNTENNSVCETTPDGVVFMKYNKDNEGFDWWSDDKQTKYIYLEAVSRRYVTTFQCSELYIDRKKDLIKQLEREKESEERAKMKEEEEAQEDSDDDLFVKFKPTEKIKPKKKENRASINGNKYKYVGKIKEYHVLKKEKKPIKDVGFSSWKNMFK